VRLSSHFVYTYQSDKATEKREQPGHGEKGSNGVMSYFFAKNTTVQRVLVVARGTEVTQRKAKCIT